MADYQRIDQEQAGPYHRLVSAEDAEEAVAGWLGSALGELGASDEVLDVGAGSGRVASLVRRNRPDVQLVCCDGAAPMLDELVARWPVEDGPVPVTVVADFTVRQAFSIPQDFCSEPDCEALQSPEAFVCPACTRTIAGTIAHAGDRLAARDELD